MSADRASAHYGGRRFLHGAAALPFAYGAYSAYPYYYSYGDDDCLAPRRVWTDFGWRVRLVNVCGY